MMGKNYPVCFWWIAAFPGVFRAAAWAAHPGDIQFCFPPVMEDGRQVCPSAAGMWVDQDASDERLPAVGCDPVANDVLVSVYEAAGARRITCRDDDFQIPRPPAFASCQLVRVDGDGHVSSLTLVAGTMMCHPLGQEEEWTTQAVAAVLRDGRWAVTVFQESRDRYPTDLGLYRVPSAYERLPLLLVSGEGGSGNRFYGEVCLYRVDPSWKASLWGSRHAPVAPVFRLLTSESDSTPANGGRFSRVRLDLSGLTSGKANRIIAYENLEVGGEHTYMRSEFRWSAARHVFESAGPEVKVAGPLEGGRTP